MTFEEEFPTLHKGIKGGWGDRRDWWSEDQGWIDEGIKECCLDKQRVREVLEEQVRRFKRYRHMTGEKLYPEDELDWAFQELGL